MNIKDGLKNLQWHSKTAKYILCHVIDILDKLDELDCVKPNNDEEQEDLIRNQDNSMVELYNLLQNFHDYQGQFCDELRSIELKTALTSKLVENDVDSDEIIRRSGEIYAALFDEFYYPNVWEESDFKEKTNHLQNNLKDRLSKRIMTEDDIPEFKERMVGSGENEDTISIEPITQEVANRRAADFVYWLDVYLRSVCITQREVADILDKAYSLFNPQPDTSRVKKQLIKSDILSRDNIIKAVFKAAVEKGFMVEAGNCFDWLKSSHLIPFFCERVCNMFANEEDNESKYAMFNGMIRFKGKILFNIDISQFRKNWYKTPSRKGKVFAPKGYLEIEDFIEEMKEGYVNYID